MSNINDKKMSVSRCVCGLPSRVSAAHEELLFSFKEWLSKATQFHAFSFLPSERQRGRSSQFIDESYMFYLGLADLHHMIILDTSMVAGEFHSCLLVYAWLTVPSLIQSGVEGSRITLTTRGFLAGVRGGVKSAKWPGCYTVGKVAYDDAGGSITCFLVLAVRALNVVFKGWQFIPYMERNCHFKWVFYLRLCIACCGGL